MKAGIGLKRAYRINLAISKALRQERSKDVLDKPLPGRMMGPQDSPFTDPEFAASYPFLHSHLSDTRYSDDSARVTSTLLVFVDSGCLRLCINDRDNGRSCFVSRSTFEEALAALEKGLREGSLDWRKKGGYNPNSQSVPF